MTLRQKATEMTMFSAKAATGVSTVFNVSDYRNITLIFGTASSANLTIKFQASASDTCPDFSAAQSVSNHWDYVQVFDYQSGLGIDGDTGISCAGTDDFRLLNVNTDYIKWLSASVTARSAGSVTLKAVAASD